ncbi:hypothetical protein N2W42_001358 [Clostridium perfringens]|uniref:Uncharacterized protein n=1 Tax=Clostridium perfringens TaxID=1502 RepID=A0A127EHR5_CLOPF|nr:hypothetical protein [Clostridium perfringens]AMN35495.1 hypothetical protein JFP838_06955 [Clostridium perfringens]EJT6340611.1 hypothetical protein [Clostridium perfringens]
MFESMFYSLTSFVLHGLANFGYWICLVIAVGGHFAYVSGFRNGAKWTTFSTIIYAVIQAMSGAISK